MVGEAGVEPAQPKRPVYSRVFSPHDQLALGVPDGYRPRSYPVHGRVPRFLGPGTSRPGRCRTCCLRCVKAALFPDELQAVRAPGRTRTSTAGFVGRHDLRFTTGAWYPRQDTILRPPSRRDGALAAELRGHGGCDGTRTRGLHRDRVAS